MVEYRLVKRNEHTMGNAGCEEASNGCRIDPKTDCDDALGVQSDMSRVIDTSDESTESRIRSRLNEHLQTMFNGSVAYDMIYEITGDATAEKISELTSLVVYRGSTGNEKESVYPDCAGRIRAFKEMGLGLKYHGTRTSKRNSEGGIGFSDNDTFRRNLLMVDCCMPQILADMTVEAHFNGVMNLRDHIVILNEKDRFGIHPSGDYPFYKKKVQDMLEAMTVAGSWDGTDGTPVCHHVFDRNDFREFLLDNMRFEYPSDEKHPSMDIIADEGKYYLNLNVQIRMSLKGNEKTSGMGTDNGTHVFHQSK